MKRIVLDLMCDLSEYEVTERAQALSSTVVRLDEVEIVGNDPAMAETLDALVEPVLSGEVKSITLSAADQVVSINKPAAERVRRRAREVKAAAEAPDKVNGFD